nr:uncharacterized protein LOC116430024 isoform X1 [Nomia melanderi]XP_031839495.1 uncharacterized protein LOC116430024 isoform X1 [Nomia melanderi]XP_031839496.1 uncharacterized protein LOC116430024 isoform X1 [Nomia melanderi]XP_031839497.1 uncharacterized protein LOC116430024 isoform X1 [Nomia melanderi]XP_031839498.1 uncharacterized protein LOC116430024 isoform X1 [Nomia melanderi]
MAPLTILLLLGCAAVPAVDSSLHDQLDEQLKQTKIEIAKLYFQESPPVQKKLYDVQWNSPWRKSFDKERPFVVNALNKIFFVEGSRVATFPADSLPSDRTSLGEVNLRRDNGSIKFIRSVVWKTVLYLLVCYSSDAQSSPCDLYTGAEGLRLKHRQTIQHKGLPMDASFFVRENRLYLVVADNSGWFAVPSLIYHWRGTYMDTVAEALTTAAVSVATFKHRDSTIIVFAQNSQLVPNIGSVVYEFKETGTSRIQFLPTVDPVSVHYYDHAGFSFIFLMNKRKPSNLFWWDGQELLDWQQVPEISAPSSIHVAAVNGDTFFLVGNANQLQLYKFENASECALLSSTKLLDGEAVVDVQVRTEKSKATAALVTVNRDAVYSVASWEVDIKEIPSDQLTEEPDVLSEHLLDLVKVLERRMSLADEAQSSWPSLVPADENLTSSHPVTIPNLILESGIVENINFFVSGDVIAPRDLEAGLNDLVHEIDETLMMSENLLTTDNINSFSGNLVVSDSAFIEQLEIDKIEIDFLNDVAVRPNTESNVAGGSSALRGNTVEHDIEIESLCGVPFKYWALNNGSSGMEINLEASDIEFSNDTVQLRSDVSLAELNVKMINDLVVDEFLDELFIIDRNQRIRGDLVYSNTFQAYNLTTRTLNNRSIDDYMTASTNQTFDRFSVKSLQLDRLIAESINGVPVSEAARVSQRNTIEGKLKLNKLHVTEKIMSKKELKLPKSRQVQIYYNVTIHTDLKVKVLDMDRYTRILLDGEEVDLGNVFKDSWTRSTDQEIPGDVAFENDVTIDRLSAERLNGFAEREFLYTDAAVIPESFGNLLFRDVEVDDVFSTEGEDGALFDDAPESLTIRGGLHLTHLRADKLFAERFNGLPVSGDRTQNFSKTMDFSAIRAKRVNVDQLYFRSFNGEDRDAFMKRAENGQNDRSISFHKSPRFSAENLRVERINGIEMGKLKLWENILRSGLKNLTIDGDLTVEDLRVRRIDGQAPEVYLRNMAEGDVVFDSEKTIDELIVQNATLRLVNGHGVNDLFKGVFSRSKEQIVPGQFSFNRMSAGNAVVRFINDRDSSGLRWIDEPLFFGDVTFDDLSVNNVATRTVNGREIHELYDNLLNVPAKTIDRLTVHGDIFWNAASSSPTSLSSLFKNAVTRTTDQSIHGDVVFEENVSVSTANGEWKDIDRIRAIVTDAVKDHEGDIEVTGQKTFKNNLRVNSLSVTGDMAVPMVNDIDVVEFNNTVARRDQDETITGHLTFDAEVAINELLVNDTAHNIPLQGVVRATDVLPPNVHFKNLVVLRGVYLKNLDGVDFDEFLKDRVTIHGDHDVTADVQFNGVVEVTGNATVTRINGIDPADLILNGVEGTQVISGSKTFAENLQVKGDVETSLLNGVDISSEYSSGVQNDEDVEITGDLVFESTVKVPEDVTVSGLVNGMNLATILDELKEETQRTLRTLKQNEMEIDESIAWSSKTAENLRNIFMYLETEEKLKIVVPNARAADVAYYEETTKLNIFGEEAGPLCGLSSNCSCPTEYVAELTENGCSVWRTNGSTTVRNYHELHSTFGVNVITNTVSSGPGCTLANGEDEFTTISWMKPGMMDTGDVLANVKETSFKIRGFLKDATVFMTDDNAAFVVLAIYYDSSRASHLTDSLVYKIDFEKNSLSLHQKLPTDGAWDVEVFKLNYRYVYLLLGCFGNSETSFLYRLDGTTSQFVTLRAFGGRTRNVKSLAQEKDQFILLDDYDTNAVNVFYYDPEFDNFYNYQSLFHDSRVNGIACFYADDPGHSDSFVIVTTENDYFYIYEYMFAQKFRMTVHHRMDDLQIMVPFSYAGGRYIFAGTSVNSTILRIVEQGPH